MPVITPGQAAFLKFEIDHGDARRKKAALQEISRRYRRGDCFNAVNRKVFETTINGMVLAEQDRKVVRWCLNTLARLGTKDGCVRYVVAALKLYQEDPEIVAAAIAALAFIYRGRIDEVPELHTVDPAVRVLAAMQVTDVSQLDVSKVRIDIDKTDVEVLKLALLTVGLNRDIENLLDPRHSNGAIVKQLGQHPDRIVRQYSVWSVMENRFLTLDDLGIPFSAIAKEEPNVQAKLLQLGAEREPDAKARHQLIHDGTFLESIEAKLGLAKGLTRTYYDGLEDLTLGWFDTEQDKAIRATIAEHFARFSDTCSPYEEKALEILEADPSLREHILFGAEGKALYSKIRTMNSSGMNDLFGRPNDLTQMFQSDLNLMNVNGKPLPMKVLFLAANPTDQGNLRIDVEARDMREQLAMVRDAKRTIDVEYALAARIDQIQRELLNVRPEVLHFSGHGNKGILGFENRDGEFVPVSGEALAELVSLSPTVECVVLNSCFSDSIASLIAPHVAAVIGCDVSVGDSAANFFTRSFYRALAHGETIERAFRLAKNELALEGEKKEADNYRIHIRSAGN
ncbi:CHAT domain-containing protein [Rhizobium sp. PP-F2F-G38]|nr:CHAT domain-containing protein [Rhizobium sp. PP-WC-1G-195]PYE91927.1 CHAT domain-containing protein [Rhizobium sp. PP-F2F-G38]TCP73962.1 CHAT domain-containing protein [Rhizobium sp. PP-CC-2G-626]